MWSWASIRPGRMVLPATSMISASFGHEFAPAVVTVSMRPSRMTTATSRTGAAPVPSMSVPPFRIFITLLRSAADRGLDAAHVLVDVVDEDAVDDLLGAHRRHAAEHVAGPRELLIAEPAHQRGRGGGVLLEQRHRLRLAAA